MAFFSTIALRTTQGSPPYKYLRVITDAPIEDRDYLEYSADEVFDPNAKFAVEYAHDGLVHIRSCRTNKYLVRRPSEIEYSIVANASEAVDDQTAWNCTLFRMDFNSDDNTVTFYHVQSETDVRVHNNLLCIDPSSTIRAISTVVDLEAIQRLPKYIALKADNGKFFDYSTMGFTSDDYGRDTVANEIKINRDGYIRIRNKGSPEDYSWIFSGIGDSIIVSSSDEDLPGALFKVVKVKDEVVALRNLESGKFCKRGWYDGEPDRLSVLATTIIKEAQFQVVETVFSRSVKVLDYDLDNSRIYNLTPISSDTHTYDNPTEEEQEATMNLTISTTKTSTWNNSFSVNVGVETSFTAGVPFIAEGKITVSAETSYEHAFGGSTEETQEVGDTYTVKVPPFTRVTGRGVATKGTCDIPFTYTQVDHLTDGTTIRTTLADGVFTGVNAYNFYHDVHYEDVPEELKLKFSQLTTSTH